MDADVAVRWMSEIGGGRLNILRKDLRWFSGAKSARERSAVDRWIQDLVTLGFVDVDWKRDEWVMADASLTTIPGGYGYALLVGARGQQLVTALARARELDDPVLVEVPGKSAENALPNPTAIFLAYRTTTELDSAAAQLGVRLIPQVYRRLAERLEDLSLGAKASCPSRNGGLIERWKPGDATFFSFPSHEPWIPGLYKHEVNRVPHYLIFRNGEWFHTDRSAGVYLVAAPSDQLVRWVPEQDCLQGQIGSLLVDSVASLPDAHRRTVGLCSGIMPYASRIRGGSIRYHNVPLDIAQVISSSLGQWLD